MTRGLFVAALLSGGCVVGGGDASFVFEDATALDVGLVSGEIRVRTSADERATVRWDGGGIGEVARPDVWQGSNGCVFVDADGGLGGGELEAEVPAGAPLTVLLESGEIDVVLDAAADVDLCVGAGDITLVVPPGRYAVDLDLGAGHVSTGIVDDPSAEHALRACAGAGEIAVLTSE